MDLTNLVGLHRLSGVDMSNENIKTEWGDSFEDCQVINFILDKKTYTAVEDPSDGYRSSMREIKLSKVAIKNVFKPVKVMGVMNKNTSNDLIEFFDVKTGKVVLSVGTRDVNDYYPYFVMYFNPENMAINTPVSRVK